MNAIPLLMGLLILSYLGSLLVSARAVRGIGLPSGAEYVALGFVIGPHVLGAVERSMLSLPVCAARRRGAVPRCAIHSVGPRRGGVPWQ